jgi:hypothetical protein
MNTIFFIIPPKKLVKFDCNNNPKNNYREKHNVADEAT